MQVYKALRGGEHPIAVREFRHELPAGEQEQLRRLIGQLSRCNDRRAASPRTANAHADLLPPVMWQVEHC